jgi:hypothetical protein
LLAEEDFRLRPAEAGKIMIERHVHEKGPDVRVEEPLDDLLAVIGVDK